MAAAGWDSEHACWKAGRWLKCVDVKGHQLMVVE